MNDKFDELARGMAQSVTRRGALQKLGVGLAGIVLGMAGLTNQAHADKGGNKHGKRCNRCVYPYGCSYSDAACIIGCEDYCAGH